MKKIIALLIAFVMVFSLTGCSKGESRDKDVIYLDFEIVNNGYGYQWLIDACEEFEELVKNKDYDGEEGSMKPGVVCKVKPVVSLTALDAMEKSGTEVFFGGGNASDLILTGNLLDITDIVNEKNYLEMDEDDASTYVNDNVSSAILNNIYGNGNQSIVDLMYEEAKVLSSVVNPDSGDTEYYTIPTHEIYSGMTYDKDAFDAEGFYFAYDTDNTVATRFVSTVTGQEVYFVKSTALDNKSVGPDGEPDTYDDGMPSSLMELITLYDYMDFKGYAPLQVPGQYLYESDFLTEGLYTALLGVDKARGQYDFTGEYDIVTALYNSGAGAFGNVTTDLAKANYIQPLIETVEISEETGYYSTWSLERYYALLFIEICVEKGWLADGYDPTSNPYSNKTAQRQFIFSGNYDPIKGKAGTRVATMSTGSYWYNESTDFNNFVNFEVANPNVTRNLLWMPFPTNIFTSVTGEVDGYEEDDYLETTTLGSGEYKTEIVESTRGDVQAISQCHANCVYFNDNVRSEPAKYEALKDWIRFFHSDQQLEKTTIRQGFRKALKYKVRDLDQITNLAEKAEIKQLMIDKNWADFDTNNNVTWEGFYKKLAGYVDSPSAEVIRYTSTKKTFLANMGGGSAFKRGEYSKICTDNTGTAYLAKLLDSKTPWSAKDAFSKTVVGFDAWGKIYQGDLEAQQLKNSGGATIVYGGETNPA